MRDFTHNWVNAPKNRGGVNVHIPKGIIDQLPGDLDPENLKVRRYGSRKRQTVMLTLRNGEDIEE